MKGPAERRGGLRARCRVAVLFAAAALAGCSHPAPEAAAPAPAPPVMEPASPPPPTSMVAPRTAAGSWRLTTEIQSQSAPVPRRGRRAPPSSLVLNDQPAAAPLPGAPAAAQQFNASVAMPGYTRAPRGRSSQAASWWPVAGDSVVVQFAQGTRGQIQLRGLLHGNAIAGEIWYLSLETGSTFQMGTFSAARQR